MLPLFALANAGVALAPGVLAGRGGLVAAIVAGLVARQADRHARRARRSRSASASPSKPDAYSWRQLAGAGALAGIGFTMSLFIAGQAFPDPGDFAAAKIAVFAASILAAARRHRDPLARPRRRDRAGRRVTTGRRLPLTAPR